MLDLRDCRGVGGAHAGPSTTCGPTSCPDELGACCYPNTECAVTTQAGCLSTAGQFRGVGSTCLVELCGEFATGACCFLPGRCELMARQTCLHSGGFFAGANLTCDQAICAASPGACCFEQVCQFLPVATCGLVNGQFRGPASLCSPSICLATCPCDWNGDGSLDFNDFVQWADQAQSGAGRAGDFNNDGRFDESDAHEFIGCFLYPPAACR
jgi:hypothetical protein